MWLLWVVSLIADWLFWLWSRHWVALSLLRNEFVVDSQIFAGGGLVGRHGADIMPSGVGYLRIRSRCSDLAVDVLLKASVSSFVLVGQVAKVGGRW